MVGYPTYIQLTQEYGWRVRGIYNAERSSGYGSAVRETRNAIPSQKGAFGLPGVCLSCTGESEKHTARYSVGSLIS